MAFYLSSRKLDVRTGDAMIALINEVDAAENGVSIGEKVALELAGRKKDIIVTLDTTDTLVEEGEIGFFEDVWEKYNIKFGEVVKVSLVAQSKAVLGIRKKLLGRKKLFNGVNSQIIRKFGSSDCGCPSHLVFIPNFLQKGAGFIDRDISVPKILKKLGFERTESNYAN